jgi:hypothetical protein
MFCPPSQKKKLRSFELDMLTFSCVCLYKAVQLKSRLEHTGTWSAAAHRPRRLCYRPAVFFRYLLSHCAPPFPARKDSVRFKKKYFTIFTVFNNCINVNIFVTWNFVSRGVPVPSYTQHICWYRLYSGPYIFSCLLHSCFFFKRRESLNSDDPVEIHEMFCVLFCFLMCRFWWAHFFCVKNSVLSDV